MKKTKLSICIATYNGEKYIKAQLESILSQIGETDEVIISDDCSTDNTVIIIESFKDERIVILKNNKKFKNYNFNFENALKNASGDFVFLSDQDDIWVENKVKRFLEVFNETKVNLIISDCFVVDAQLNMLSQSFFKIRNSSKGFFKNFYKNSYLGCSMAFDRKVLKCSLPFPMETSSHDTWIGLIGEIVGKTYFLNEPLMFFRRHGANYSVHNLGDAILTNKSAYSMKNILVLRLLLIKMLLKRYIKIRLE
jgi:glycosyltransferase involved in cell wall biosynthesis